jgi:2-(1,2-epoxy-1,2-dihydrophenyl)acetyl-CoA isomerase
MSDVLTRELQDGVLVLTMNRPERLNALNPALMRELVEATKDAAEDARVKAVLLRGAGKAFCSGGDIAAGKSKEEKRELTPEEAAQAAERAAKRGPDTFEMRVNWLRQSMEAARLLHQMPKPTIAAVRGAAAGAGFALACACDFRIVSDTASFTTAFVKVGFSGDYGGSYFLTRLLGTAKARELYLLGSKISAQEADRLGLVTRLVTDDDLESASMEFAARFSEGPPIAYRYMKQNLNAAEEGRLEDIFDLEALNMTRTGQTEDHKEAAMAFFEKRKPVFRGA